MIPTIKQAIGHEAGCYSQVPQHERNVHVYHETEEERYACNCSRREMIAWLDESEEIIKQGDRICTAILKNDFERAHYEAKEYSLFADLRELADRSIKAGEHMSAIDQAVSRLFAYEKSHPGMTPREKADFIKRVVGEEMPEGEYRKGREEGEHELVAYGWNEFRSELLGE